MSKSKLTAEQRETIRAAMSIMGSVSTKRKATAARANGKLGGRPRKKKLDSSQPVS